MNTGIIVAGLVGVAGVGYYMYMQAKYPPAYYKMVEEQQKQIEETARQQQASFDKELAEHNKEEDTRRKICRINTVDDLRAFYMEKDGKISNTIERSLKLMASSSAELGDFLVNARKQVGGCDF